MRNILRSLVHNEPLRKEVLPKLEKTDFSQADGILFDLIVEQCAKYGSVNSESLRLQLPDVKAGSEELFKEVEKVYEDIKTDFTTPQTREFLHAYITDKVAEARAYNGVMDAAEVVKDRVKLLEVLPRIQAGATFTLEEPRDDFISFTDIMNRQREPGLIYRVLPAQGVINLYGPSTAGKTFVAVDMAACFSLGDEWCGRRVKAAQVHYFALEDVRGVMDRMQGLERHRHPGALKSIYLYDGAEPGNEFRLFIANGKNLILNDASISSLVNKVNRKREPGAPTVIFIDTLREAILGADSNSDAHMALAVEALKRVARECQALVIFIHHTGKDVSRGSKGSNELRNKPDGVLEVLAPDDGDPDYVEIRADKVKNGARQGERFGMVRVEVPINDNLDNERETTCVMRHLDETKAKKSTSERLSKAEKLVLKAFENLEKTKKPVEEDALKASFYDQEDPNKERRTVDTGSKVLSNNWNNGRKGLVQKKIFTINPDGFVMRVAT